MTPDRKRKKKKKTYLKVISVQLPIDTEKKKVS